MNLEDIPDVPVNQASSVMIVDDHSIMRDGLQEMLDRTADFQVVGQARDGCEAVEMADRLKPDVVIMDVIMPVKNGVDACREIMAAVPETRVLVLTASTNDKTVIDAIAAGATGYLQKFTGKDELLATIRDVVDGEFRVPGDVVRRAFAGVGNSPAEDDSAELTRLTEREREILKLFAEGMSYAKIGEARGNRPLTIRNAVYAIRNKLGAKSSQEMVVWAVRNGLLEND